MTFRWYKTFKFGPTNITVSRSGLSTSIRGKRVRVGKRAGRGGVRQSIKLPGGYRLRKG
jgi:hypothetical protein